MPRARAGHTCGVVCSAAGIGRQRTVAPSYMGSSDWSKGRAATAAPPDFTKVRFGAVLLGMRTCVVELVAHLHHHPINSRRQGRTCAAASHVCSNTHTYPPQLLDRPSGTTKKEHIASPEKSLILRNSSHSRPHSSGSLGLERSRAAYAAGRVVPVLECVLFLGCVV